MNLGEKLKLYGVTDENENIIERAELALKGGTTCLQYRAKKSCDINIPFTLSKLCQRYNVPFIVNDDVKLAQKCHAWGVHLGQSDMSVKEARAILGDDAIIGVSASNLKEALQGEIDGANYLGVGAVFQTFTKMDASMVEYSTLRAIATTVSIPVVAIGGITAENLCQLSFSGISGVAVVSAIFGAKDIYSETKKLQNLISNTSFTAPKIKSVILDFDGTLVDSLGMWDKIVADFLKVFGAKPSANLLDKISALGTNEGLKLLKNMYNIPNSIEELKEIFAQKIISCTQKCKLKKGVKELAKTIEEKGILACIASSGDKKLINAILERENLLGAFGEIYDSNTLHLSKNSPDFYLKVLELMRASLKNTTLFEDAPFAIKSANAIGLNCIGIYDSYWSEDISCYTLKVLNNVGEWDCL